MSSITLVVRKILGILTPKEQPLFDQWLADSETNRQFYEYLKVLDRQGKDISKISEIDVDMAWQKVLRKSAYRRKTGLKKIAYHKNWLGYAAIFVLLIGGGTFFALKKTSNPAPLETSTNSITLDLGHGQIKTIQPGNTLTIKTASTPVLQYGEQLDYTTASTSNPIVYNTLSVPYGKRFQVLLADGSLVHLNSGSSLRYPNRFEEGSTRKVFLAGEAFFEVAKDSSAAFVVVTKELDVQVYGTKFNVTAYPDEPMTNTVLVEGSVGIFAKAENVVEKKPRLLNPGQKAAWTKKEGALNISDVDTSIYTDWLTGRLTLKNMPFTEIAKILERHYNVQIINNHKKLSTMKFTATFDKESIQDVLEVFKEDTPFSYRIDGRTITINPIK